MSRKAKEKAFLPDIRKLISSLTGLNDNEENFKLCEIYSLQCIIDHNYLDTNQKKIETSIKNIIQKLKIQAHHSLSHKLDCAFRTLSNFELSPNPDLKWMILSLILNLAESPTSLNQIQKLEEDQPKLLKNEEHFDWASYLNEGNERFILEDQDSGSDISESDEDFENSPKKSDADNRYAHENKNVMPTSLQDKKEILSNYVREYLDLKNCLKLQTIDCWWNRLDVYCEPISTHAAANLAGQWNLRLHDLLGDQKPILNSISEYKVIREILWMLQSPSYSYLFQRTSEDNIILRENVSIPSLTDNTLQHYLEEILPYIKIRNNFQIFQNELYTKDKSLNPPRTYEAYEFALNNHLLKISQRLVKIEEKVAKQDGISTLLSLMIELKPILCELKILHDLHLRAILDWKNYPNWICAAKLLSSLYYSIQNHHQERQYTIAMDLFLHSFSVYMELVDGWLTYGILIDPHLEFIISNKEDKSIEREGLWTEHFFIENYKNSLKTLGEHPLPILTELTNRVLHAANSVQLLLRLDRLREAARHSESLYSDYLRILDKESERFSRKKISTSPSCVFYSTIGTNTIINCNQEDDSFDIQLNLLKDLKDSFLEMAFETYIPELKKQQSIECYSMNSSLSQASNHQAKNPKYEIINRISERIETCHLLNRSFIQLFDETLNKSYAPVKEIMIREFRLLQHLQALRSVFLLEAGDLMHEFYRSFFKQVEEKQQWAFAFKLSMELQTCIDTRLFKESGLFSFEIDSEIEQTDDILTAIDSITLRYSLEWPLTMIITQNNLVMYNEIFRFLLKIKWALWSLKQLRFKGMHKSTLTHRLQMLRMWLLHLIGSVHCYIMGQVLQSLGLELLTALDLAPNLETIISAHDIYVKGVFIRTLQPKNPNIKSAILQLVSLCTQLRHFWNASTEEFYLKQMEMTYLKCHWFLGNSLRSAVEDDFNQDLAGLCTAIRVPSTNL